jgi:oligoendopeptidase F
VTAATAVSGDTAGTTAPPPPRWDLSDLYQGVDDPRIEQALADAKRRAEAFAKRYGGRIASLDLAPAELAEAIAEFEQIHAQMARPGAFASLLNAAEANEANGALLQRVRERTTEATLPLLFFELELMAVDGAQLKAAFLPDPALARFRHFLHTVRVQAPFRRSEPEERILEEKANTGRRAFQRLFDQMLAGLRFSLPDGDPDAKALTLSEVLDLQHDPDRDVRRHASLALTNGLEPHARTFAYLLNTLIQDKATEDRLRGYAYQEQARHLTNELSAETVELVVRTATGGYGLVARYYEAKRRVLGLDRLTHYDRYAPVTSDEIEIGFDAARDLVLHAFGNFAEPYRAAGEAFFAGNWIDAETRANKRGGAFCSYVTPDAHPYLFLNYLNKAGDVRTLAHELGHGIHSYLSRGQGYLSYHGTLPVAEVASTFAEQLVFDAMRNRAGDDDARARLVLYAEQIEQAIATIFPAGRAVPLRAGRSSRAARNGRVDRGAAGRPVAAERRRNVRRLR